MRITIAVFLLAAAMIAAEPQTAPFAVGVLRRDGVVIPFATFDGKRWSTHWPKPNLELTVPVNLPSVPSGWLGPVPAVETWTAWLAKTDTGGPRTLTVTQPDWVDAHCFRQIGLRTNHRPVEPPPPPHEQPYPKDGLVVAPAHPVEPIVSVPPTATELAALTDQLLGAFNRAERVTARRFDHPVREGMREQMSVAIEAAYAYGAEPRVYYIEASRAYETMGSHECQGVAFGTGWFIREHGTFRTLAMAVDELPCERRGASYMLPLGVVRSGSRLFWLVQFSGWDHERYVVIEPKLKAVDAVLSVWGGGC